MLGLPRTYLFKVLHCMVLASLPVHDGSKLIAAGPVVLNVLLQSLHKQRSRAAVPECRTQALLPCLDVGNACCRDVVLEDIWLRI